MREFVWNRYEFIECLGVLPEVDEEFGTCHTFRVERDGLRLELSVSQYDGDVYLSLYREGVGPPVFTMGLIACEGARYVRDKLGDFLEFAPAKCFGRRYDGERPAPFGFRVSVDPHIRVEPFSE
ncbi:MAG TPA: hypothetical protein VM936_12330 [Pyrinomonadaceae bacterium]|jgi:hypothetical protein|nr:hypothetical protein [Pyrinomonadaceae bacterium]